ncbi:polymeric immunoglobulin receptor-like protein [Labeo rohita]|nr:polymeric immunoglobulin receptor-like protein [Labeo rohita]
MFTVQTGGSVIIPCRYDKKYTKHKKYWCFHADGSYYSCSILAYANETKGKVSVIDHPDQRFFTVTMRNLQDKDTGTYWCAVETIGIDVTEQLHLTVRSAPDVFVVSSSVSGHEGGDISVQCLYSSGYKDKDKQWCRYKDQSCYTEGRTNTSQNSSVQISDDGRNFIVLMTGLRLTDSGWYCCSVGGQNAFVQLKLTEDPRVPVPTVTQPKTNRNDTNINRDGASDAENVASSSSALAENDVTYTTVTVRPKTKASSPVYVEDQVTYSSVKAQSKTKQSSPVSVEDEVTYNSVRGVECDHNWLNHIYTVQTGGSVTIPCYYDEKTPPQKKYWHSENDYTYRDTTEENLSVIDHPDQSLFTVTMRNLQNKDTGHYGCVVNIQEQLTVTYGLYIKVQSAPDVSVVSSSVSGHEAPGVSVVNSSVSGHEEQDKHQIRDRNGSTTTDMVYSKPEDPVIYSTINDENPNIYSKPEDPVIYSNINDEKPNSLFTVTMRNLQNKDTGHYGCVVDIQEQLTVTYGLYIKVQSDLDVFVVSSSVSGHEGVECDHNWLNHIYTVQTGGSVTIPCYYDEKTPPQKKYWHSETDHTYRNTTEENLSVIDEPDQSLFTVTMRNLQNKDTGHYGCVVDIQEQLTVTYGLYIKVQSAPDMFVVSSSVSGHEGGDISVQCLYSSGYQSKPKRWCRYKDPDVSVVSSSVSGHEGGDISVQCLYSSGNQNEVKRWCRYKDQSCYTVGRTDTSQNSSVQISDDGRRLFTVLMTGLRLNDSGWYCCCAGNKLNPVHLTVTEAKPYTEKDISETGFHENNNNTTVVIDKLLKIYSKPEDPVIYSNINDENPNKFSMLITGTNATEL